MKYFLIVMISSLFLVSCVDNSIKTEDKWTYNVIEIDGMTCIKWNSGAYVGGLTCNWDEWKGEAR